MSGVFESIASPSAVSGMSGVSPAKSQALAPYSPSIAQVATGGSSLLGAFSPFLGGLMQYASTAMGRDWQEQMYERQLSDQRQLIKEEREYNKPSKQVARMREAGLNPALVFSNGMSATVSGSSAGSPPSTSSPAYGSLPVDMNALSGLSAMAGITDLLASARKSDAEANAIDTYKRAESEASTAEKYAAAALSKRLTQVQTSIERSNLADALKNEASARLVSLQADIEELRRDVGSEVKTITMPDGSTFEVPMAFMSFALDYMSASAFGKTQRLNWRKMGLDIGKVDAEIGILAAQLPTVQLEGVRSALEISLLAGEVNPSSSSKSSSSFGDPKKGRSVRKSNMKASGELGARAASSLQSSSARRPVDVSLVPQGGTPQHSAASLSPYAQGVVDVLSDEQKMRLEEINRYINRLDSRSRQQLVQDWIGVITAPLGSAAFGYGMYKSSAARAAQVPPTHMQSRTVYNKDGLPTTKVYTEDYYRR